MTVLGGLGTARRVYAVRCMVATWSPHEARVEIRDSRTWTGNPGRSVLIEIPGRGPERRGCIYPYPERRSGDTAEGEV